MTETPQVPIESVAANPTPASLSEAQPNPAPSKFKLKVDGEEQEVDADTLVRERQKYLASEKRFQEASEMRKSVESLLQRAQQGDLSWLKGLVPKELINKWAESELLEHIEWEKKPEAERRAILAEQKARALEEQMSAKERQQLEEQQRYFSDVAHQEIERDIVSAIKELGYDKNVTPRLIRRIAEQMQASLEASDDPQAKPIPAKLASERAYKGMKVDARELLSILPPNEVLEMLPPKVRDAIRKAELDQAISDVPLRMKKKLEGDLETSKPRTKVKRMPTDDWFNRMEKRFQ